MKRDQQQLEHEDDPPDDDPDSNCLDSEAEDSTKLSYKGAFQYKMAFDKDWLCKHPHCKGT